MSPSSPQVTPVSPRPLSPHFPAAVPMSPHSLSFRMPTSRHFWRRQAWHCRRLALVMGQLREKGQVKRTPLLMERLGGHEATGLSLRVPRGGRGAAPYPTLS